MAATRIVSAGGMSSVLSFHSSAVDRQQLKAITREYFALERARVYRRLTVARFGALALAVGVIGLGFHWMSPLASWGTLAVCLAVPVSVWTVELSCDRRLARRLANTRATRHATAIRKL